MGHTLCSSHIETHKAQKNERPKNQTDILLFLQKNTPTPRVSPPFPIYFSPKSRGIPGSGNNNAFMFPPCKRIVFPQSVKVYFYGSVCFPLSHRQFPYALICLAGSSPVAELCGPVTQGLCLQGGSIVNLLDTLSCGCVQLCNRPLAVFCSAAVYNDL